MMHDKIKGIAEYLVRECLHGFYDKRDVNHGDHDTAIMRAYFILMSCIRRDIKAEQAIAQEVTKAILMAYWGRALGEGDIRGTRYTRACHDVHRALTDSIQKTIKNE